MAMTRQTLRQGLIVGLIGYVAVAAFYGLFDLLAARGILYTPDLLGKSLFNGLPDPAALGVPIGLNLMTLAGYNGLHLVVSLAIGLVVTGLVDYSEQRPAQARMVLMAIIAGFLVTIAAVGILSTPIRQVLPWWSIVFSNTLAVITAGSYLVRKRPGVWHRLNPFAREARRIIQQER